MPLNPIELFQIMSISLGYTYQGKPWDAIFVPGRAQGDWEGFDNPFNCDIGLLQTAVALCTCASLDSNPYYVIPGYGGSYMNGRRIDTGYPGFTVWRDVLINIGGMDPTLILGTPIAPGAEQTTHTRAETDGFARLAKERRWQRAVVVAHSHQLPRVLGCLVKSLSEADYLDMKVVPVAPQWQRWDLEVYGSLGQQKMPRWHHIAEEYKRLLEYVALGYMAPLHQVRNFLLNAVLQ